MSDKVSDADLRNWLDLRSSDVRDVIVEIVLPKRIVKGFRDSIEVNESNDRAKTLGMVCTKIAAIKGVHMAKALVTSGTILVQATSLAVLNIIQMPSVKFIHPNRKLK